MSMMTEQQAERLIDAVERIANALERHWFTPLPTAVRTIGGNHPPTTADPDRERRFPDIQSVEQRKL